MGRIPGFELAGYERSFLDAFSGRRRAILAHLERLELPYTAAHTQMAALHTRRRKENRSLADLVPEWCARARALGLVRERMALRQRLGIFSAAHGRNAPTSCWGYQMTRRGFLGSTAIAAVLYVADLVGPNGSWGPFLWGDKRPPKEMRLNLHFEGSVTAGPWQLEIEHIRAKS